MPRRASDLKGCWRSERGDLQVVSDDPEQKPIGQVRICYCFDQSGRGSVSETYTDGDACTGALNVKLGGNRLTLHHDRLRCTGAKGFMVPEDIDCQAGAGDAAACDKKSLGRFPGEPIVGERYERATADECQSIGSR